jgi:hypothetical protein
LRNVPDSSAGLQRRPGLHCPATTYQQCRPGLFFKPGGE